MYYSRPQIDLSDWSIRILLGLTILFMILLFGCLLIYGPLLVKTAFAIVFHQVLFWLVLTGVVLFGLYRHFRNRLDYTGLEVIIYIFSAFLVVVITYSTSFFKTTGLEDFDVRSGYVVQANYDEEYTTRDPYTVTKTVGSGKNARTVTETKYRNVHHPEQYYFITNTGTTDHVRFGIYKKYVQLWGNQQKEMLHRSRQISIGDGNRYFVTFPGAPDKLVPWAGEFQVENYLKASKTSVHKKHGQITAALKPLLMDYPRVSGGTYGFMNIKRILVAGGDVPNEWRQSVGKRLDDFLAVLNARTDDPKHRRKINLIVYVVNSNDRSFRYALEQHWLYGKKNDAVIIIGCTQFPKIDWVEVIDFWCKTPGFGVYIRDRLQDEVKTLANPEVVVNSITKQVELPPTKGGWERKSMHQELMYLAANIALSMTVHLIALGVVIIVCLGLTWWFENNQDL